MNKTVYLLVRLTTGISMFGHGFVRLFKLHVFAGGIVREFSKSMLPDFMVTVFAYALPFAEFFVGLLLLVGLVTRQAAIAGAIVMLILIFGSSMIENWDVIVSQMIHVTFFTVVIQFVEANSYAMDRLRRR